MPTEPHDEAEAYAVSWDPELEAVVNEWHSTPPREGFEDGMADTLAVIEERDATKLLSDCRGFDSFPYDGEWLLKEWVPKLRSAGLEDLAIVYPVDRTAKFGIDRTARDHIDPPFDIVFSEDIAEARRWLKTR